MQFFRFSCIIQREYPNYYWVLPRLAADLIFIALVSKLKKAFVKTSDIRQTLAYNVRLYRREMQISQQVLAQRAGLSFRLIQNVESGTTNPSLETISLLAKCFKITVSRLLELHAIQLENDDKDFLSRFESVFTSFKLAVKIRDLDGNLIWSNSAMASLTGVSITEIQTLSSIEVRAIVKSQLQSEKRGVAFPYTIFYQHPKNSDSLVLRFHPTLIFKKGVSLALFSAEYISDLDQDCTSNYYDFCTNLFRCIPEDPNSE